MASVKLCIDFGSIRSISESETISISLVANDRGLACVQLRAVDQDTGRDVTLLLSKEGWEKFKSVIDEAGE